MNWNIEGSIIIANYLGVSVKGLVVESRVKYGGKIQHTVELESAVTLPWRRLPVLKESWEPASERLLIEDENVIFVFEKIAA